VVVLAAVLGWLLVAVVTDARTVSALRVESVGVPYPVHGSNGREHIDYDLVPRQPPRPGDDQAGRALT
jgi:hypothetical protein